MTDIDSLPPRPITESEMESVRSNDGIDAISSLASTFYDGGEDEHFAFIVGVGGVFQLLVLVGVDEGWKCIGEFDDIETALLEWQIRSEVVMDEHL